jgi:hypothetical protein
MEAMRPLATVPDDGAARLAGHLELGGIAGAASDLGRPSTRLTGFPMKVVVMRALLRFRQHARSRAASARS